MNEGKIIRFGFASINTDEFALLTEAFDASQETVMNTAMAFPFNTVEKTLAVKCKFVFRQHERTLAVIAVTCQFHILPEDWETVYSEEENKLTVPKLTATHFAGLTVGAARGIFHAKTEKHSMNALIIPPVFLSEFIKSDLVLNESKIVHGQ
jgi:hypothetical protein